jgi:outer membrane autotransporter protein
LPPGVYPIIGPELATYGVVQPLARQLGLAILGTLDDRVGDTYQPDCSVAAPAPETTGVDLPTRKSLPTKKAAAAPCPLFAPSIWGRFFGQTFNNHYGAFADPRASGDMGGFQGGVDLLRGPIIPGGHDRAGLYGAYGDASADVTGLVTNPAATAYVLTHTGSLNLNAWSAGGYWTHVGQGAGISTPCCRGLVRRLGRHSICQARHQRHGLHCFSRGGRAVRLAATGAGLRARAARADPVAEGFVPSRL